MFKNLEFKVGVFIVVSISLMVSSLVFVAYKKGFFSESYEFHLSSRSGDGLSEGTSVIFSGFEIGKVTKLELAPSGIVLITVKTPMEHSKWIRETSSFVLNKPLMGSPKIIVLTSNLNAKVLPTSKTVEIKTIDGINEAIAKVQPVLERVEGIVRNVEQITGTMSNKTSLIAMATGRNESGDDLAQILKKSAELSESLRALLDKADTMVGNTNEHLYGKEGMIKELKSSLKRVDEILKNASKISADTAASTTDLAALRTEIDIAVRNANSLMNEIDSKIPLKAKKEVKLP